MPTINKPKKRLKERTELGKTYQSSAWHKLRKAYFMSHPLCETCLCEGRITPTEEIHHKVPLSVAKDEAERKDLLLDENNLLALCKDCHHKWHNENRKK